MKIIVILVLLASQSPHNHNKRINIGWQRGQGAASADPPLNPDPSYFAKLLPFCSVPCDGRSK